MATEKETREVEIILNAQQANASLKDMAAGAALMNNQLNKMSADDPRREQLKQDFQELKQRIKETRDEINGTVLSQEQLRAKTEQLNQANAATVQQGQKLTASYKEIKEAAGVLEKQLEELSGDDPDREKLIEDYQELKARMVEMKAEFTETAKSAHELQLEQLLLAQANKELVETGQQAGASMNQMKAAASILEQQLNEISRDDPGRAQLIKDYQLLQQQMEAAKDEVKTYVKSEQELREETARLNQENQQVILNGQKVSASFNEMDAAAKKLEAQLKDLSADDPDRKKLLADYHELQERLGLVKKELGETAKEGFTMKDALMFAGVDLGLEAAVDLVKEMGAAIAETVKEFGTLRSEINSLTGATGQELDDLTAGIAAVAKTFGKENQEVLTASNALAKQMGISQKEALDLIQKGFVAGADANGEFLDQVKEYPAQFKAAGVSASEFIAIVSKSQTDGVFSDKGADVVKEFGLRIREQTSATKDAMFAAFGPEFTNTLLDGVNKGTITTTEALKRIATEMDETKLTASQAQTVIADVFGGPGEDAGLDFIKSMKNVGVGIDQLIDKNNVYVQRQQALLDSNKELAAVQNDLAKEFEGGTAIIDTLSNKAMTVLYSLLGQLVVIFKELFQPVREIWDAFLDLGESMGLFSKEGTSARGVGEMLGNVIRALLTPTRLLWGAIADVVKAIVDWAKHSESAQGYIRLMISPVQALFDLLRNGPAYFAGFSAAAEASFGAIGRAWQRIKDRDFSGAKDEFMNIGKNAGDAYSKAFADALAKKVTVAAPEQAAAAPDAPEKRAAGGDGTTAKDQADAEKAAAKLRKEARDKADQEHLDALKAMGDQELEYRDVLANRATSDAEKQREQERQKIYDDADKKYQALTGKEIDYQQRVQSIVDEQQLALRTLAAKYTEEEEKRRQEAIDKKIEQNAADAEVAAAELGVKLANGVIDEQAYQDAIYQVQLEASRRELELVKQKSGAESAEYKKALSNKLKEEADYAAKKKKQDDDLAKFEKALSAVKKVVNSQEVDALGEMLGKKNAIYKAAVVAQKAIAIAEIGIGLQKQWVANAEAGAKISAAFPPVSIPLGTAYTFGMNALAAAGAAASTAKVLGFRTGGATSAAAMGREIGLSVGTNGKLVDSDGYAVAGVVHENEYVIPAWLRQDPTVVQMEQYLEARRVRGFASGGATSGDSSAAVAALPASSEVVDLLRQLVANQQQQDARMDAWARELKVVQSLYDFDQDYGTYKKVNNESGIRK
ncbi:phage tail tape measure protein [Hymenobacter crusticola]|uniref:Phage tail tape measure protein domain-containing protein n=1 Tax=Hymenobacter crusticola TaxID=1770526 RepID=A0A243W9K5_9BACT|nr:phage tail tape measure protein [Hymenobacter crusticola]OUJ71984.1 hypothetical protein BXP70_20450 [Hymenobacter crusticola]